MPPKRSASSSSAGASNSSKKAKNDNSDNSNDAQPAVPRSKRWSTVSGSANADDAYKSGTVDPIKAYSYISTCQPPYQGGDDEDEWEDEEEDDESSDQENGKAAAIKNIPTVPCDAGESCLCNKPAADNPDHPWIFTDASLRKHATLHVMIDLRCPDLFEMYTFNDHAGYGVLEVVQNLLLDFVEAENNWKEQWAICEAAILLYMGPAIAPLYMIDDGSAMFATERLIMHMFLCMLAKLQAQDLLKPDSEVKNLGTIMALYIKLVHDLDSDGYLPEDDAKPKKSSKATFTFKPSDFDSYIFTYATKNDIKLTGPSNIADLIDELDDEIDLPTTNPDPWGFTAAFKKYTKDHATSHRPGKKGQIGGDSLDITTWSSAERKQASFTKKDPLGKKEIDAIKDGMILQLG